jgi:hypothetical protein
MMRAFSFVLIFQNEGLTISWTLTWRKCGLSNLSSFFLFFFLSSSLNFIAEIKRGNREQGGPL